MSCTSNEYGIASYGFDQGEEEGTGNGREPLRSENSIAISLPIIFSSEGPAQDEAAEMR
jgi:hypothetical protein